MTLAFPKPTRADRPRRARRSTSSPALRAYREAHPTCEVLGCGKDACPEPHHILPRGGRRGRIDEAWNLLSLCSRHHASYHALGWRTWLNRTGERVDHLAWKIEAAHERAA